MERKKGIVAGCVLSAGLSDIHESVEDGRDSDDEEGEVGEGESLGDEEVLGVEVEDNLIASGEAREGSKVGSIVGVSSSEVVKSMSGICSWLVYEDIVYFSYRGVFFCVCVGVKSTCSRLI